MQDTFHVQIKEWEEYVNNNHIKYAWQVYMSTTMFERECFFTIPH
jgi:hypothetical protein